MTAPYPSPILHLICGLPGSGKTTLAKSIAASTGALIFSPDEWIKDIWGAKAETEGNAYRDRVEQLQWKIARRAMMRSNEVIIEWGTWGKSDREKLRDETKTLGGKVKFYYLNVPRELLKQRILDRNRQPGPHEFYVAESEIETFLDDCFSNFQAPTEAELATYDEVG